MTFGLSLRYKVGDKVTWKINGCEVTIIYAQFFVTTVDGVQKLPHYRVRRTMDGHEVNLYDWELK